MTFSTGFVGVEVSSVSWLVQLTVGHRKETHNVGWDGGEK
jgi:hypothetical protein